MGGETKLLRFSEGVSTTSPTPATTQIGNLVTYSTTTAFLTAKGASVSPGDIFFNSSETAINLYDFGNKWRSIFPEKTPITLTSAYTATVDDVHLHGSAVSGEFTIMLLAPSSVPTRKLFVMNIGAYRSIELKAASSGQFLWDKGAANSIYLSGRQYVNVRSDGTYWLVEGYNPLTGYARDIKSPNTSLGGSSIANNPQTRTINQITGDATNFLSLPGSNRILVERGTVDYEASAPSYRAGTNQLLLINATDSSVYQVGHGLYGDGGDATQIVSFLNGTIEASNSKLWELWHYTSDAIASRGLGGQVGNFTGDPSSYVTFAEIKFTKRL